MADESSFHPPNKELEQRAQLFAERATTLLEEIKGKEGDIASKSMMALLYFLQSQNCYAELNRREAIETDNRDRNRENRHFWIEIGLTILVVFLIGAELYLSVHYGRLGLKEGQQQAAILEDMKRSTAATASLQTETLELLRKQEVDRAKKPRLALYLGNTPIDKATVHPTIPNGPTQSIAHLDLFLKNEGDAPLGASEIHALVPEDTNIDLSPLPPVPEYEEPSKPATRTLSYAIPLVPIGKPLRIRSAIFVPKNHTPFRVTFTLTSAQLQAVAPLGSLTVLPPKP